MTDWKWLCYQVATLSLPYTQSFYLALGALYLFIPIMGRSGASINSEVVIANMLSVLFCLLLSFSVNNHHKRNIFYNDISIIIMLCYFFPDANSNINKECRTSDKRDNRTISFISCSTYTDSPWFPI